MSDAMTGTMADWIALWRPAMAAHGLRYWEVDERAGLGDGYMAKLMCGQVQAATWPTIVKINRVLGISLYAERAALTP
jgi:hypothetical protein